jgi:hypothetical protein
MAEDLPLGFSAKLENNNIMAYGDLLANALVYNDPLRSLNVEGSYPNWGYDGGSGNCGWFDLRGTCNGTAFSPGFTSTCTTSRQAYDIRPQNHPQKPIKAVVYKSDVFWDINEPNRFTFTVLVKDQKKCVGEYLKRQCTFEAAQMAYPIQIFPCSVLGPTNTFKGEGSTCISLNSSSTYMDDKKVGTIPSRSEVGMPSSTFGGIPHYLKTNYNNKLSWYWDGKTWNATAEGPAAQSAVLDSAYLEFDDTLTGPDDVYPPTSPLNPDYCHNTYYSVVENLEDPESPHKNTTVLENSLKSTVRTLMFYVSALHFYDTTEGFYAEFTNYTGTRDEQDHTGQTRPGHRSAEAVIYNIRYRFWAASLTVTSAIVLMTLPTFWGFWLLRGRPTLSPVDTAAVLDAPIVHTEQEMIDQRLKLKLIGERPLYSAGRDGSSAGPMAV